MLVSLSAIAILLILSAFFSGSETALTAASRPLMHQMAQKGDRRAATVERLHAKTERLIGAILLGNNLVNILASALATSLMIAAYGEAGVAYATIVMTLMILILAEILPKTYAFKNANRTALWVAPVVNALVFVLAPVTHAIQLVTRAMFKAFGVDFDSGAMLGGQAAELRGAIELHAGDDQSVRHERAMLRSVLDLADVQVGEIMIHRKNVDAIDADEVPRSIVDQVLASPYTRIPLWRGKTDNVVAVLHVKALLREVRAQDRRIEDVDIASLAAKPWFIPESTTLLDQLLAFRDRHEHFSLVVDEYGSLMGIVTLEDILEEIVGDISDEHDVAVTGARGHSDGSFTVWGSVTIRDLNREFEWNLPDEEAATVAGLVLHESRRIPEVGQAFMFHDFRFEILTRHRHQITSVRITPPMELRRRLPQRG
ncbi:MAG: HlyC/CorC family transporter [Rhodospirillales bacterium]|jgi:Mg2+/Co2+ transporter CorB|nr:HlyC/CorC family transporter [Rhodospirillales bacterium]MDP6775090.1 HlyC/CorC family transporter [Rhodospirillales bacterium]